MRKEHIFLAMLFSAIFLRLSIIDFRPMHHDEGVNGYFAEEVLNGKWKYNPENFHGPSAFYLYALAFLVFGKELYAMRIVSVLFAVASAIVIYNMREKFEKGFVFASFFLLFSPTFFYYSLDAIHEIIFAFATFASLVYALKAVEESTQKNFITTASMLALMFITKEGSFLIAPAILIIAIAYALILGKRPSENFMKKLGVSALVFALIFCLFFTSFGSNLQGISDAFKAPFLWSSRMQRGEGHEKPEFYYVEVLLKTELFLVMFAILGAIIAFKANDRFFTAIAVFSLLFIIGASVPRYKVPWGLVTLIPFLATLAGYTMEKMENRLMLFFVIVAPIMIWQSIAYSSIDSTASFNKLAYVETTFEAKEVMETVRNFSQAKVPRIAIITAPNTDVWPLVWAFNKYSTFYYNEINNVYIESYDFLILDSKNFNELERKQEFNRIKEVFEIKRFALRAGLELFFFEKRPLTIK